MFSLFPPHVFIIPPSCFHHSPPCRHHPLMASFAQSVIFASKIHFSHRYISPHRFTSLIDPPPSKRSLVHLAMSSEKKEFDEKLFKRPVDEGRTEGEVAEVAEVSPATASRRKATSVKDATIKPTPPRGSGPRTTGRLTPFAGRPQGDPACARCALASPESHKALRKKGRSQEP